MSYQWNSIIPMSLREFFIRSRWRDKNFLPTSFIIKFISIIGTNPSTGERYPSMSCSILWHNLKMTYCIVIIPPENNIKDKWIRFPLYTTSVKVKVSNFLLYSITMPPANAITLIKFSPSNPPLPDYPAVPRSLRRLFNNNSLKCASHLC